MITLNKYINFKNSLSSSKNIRFFFLSDSFACYLRNNKTTYKFKDTHHFNKFVEIVESKNIKEIKSSATFKKLYNLSFKQSTKEVTK